MKRTLAAILLILLPACATQKQYTLDEFRDLDSFEATVFKVVDLPDSPTFQTAVSGRDKQICLKTTQGVVIVLDRVPTSTGGNFCRMIDSWLELKVGKTYTFPELLLPQPQCIEVYAE